MPRLRRLAPFALPWALLTAALGCERLAGVDGSFQRQSTGASGSGGEGVGGQGGEVGSQGNGGSNSGGGQAGVGGNAGAPPMMGASGAGGSTPSQVVVTALVTGQHNVRQMVSDKSTLFWVSAGTEASNFADGAVRACAVTGCEDAPRSLAEEQPKPEFIGLTDSNAGQLPESAPWSTQVYWTTSLGGTVLRCAKTGCPQPSVVADNQASPRGVNVSTSASSPTGGIAGDVTIYWATAGDGSNPGEVKRCKLDLEGPCTAPEVLETGLKAPASLVTGLRYIYWYSPGTAANSFADGELYRFRKNPEPAPGSSEPRSYPMSKTLHAPVSLELQVSKLFLSTLGSSAGDTAAGVWVGDPLAQDGSQAQMKQFVPSGPVTATVVSPKAVYWASGGTLYGCNIERCPGTGPIQLATQIGSGPMYVDQGTVEDVIYTVSGNTILTIRVPLSLTALPP